MSNEIKISSATDLVDPRMEFADALVELAKKDVPAFNVARIKITKCPHCKRHPYFDTAGSFKLESGVEGEEALELPIYVIRACCSAHYAKQNEGLSIKQQLWLRAQAEKEGRS